MEDIQRNKTDNFWEKQEVAVYIGGGFVSCDIIRLRRRGVNGKTNQGSNSRGSKRRKIEKTER